MPTKKIRRTALLSDAIDAELQEVARVMEVPAGSLLNQCVVLGLRQMQRVAFPQRTVGELVLALHQSGVALDDVEEAMKQFNFAPPQS